MQNNKKNLIINDTEKQFKDSVDLQSYASDGTATCENLRLDGGENKSCIVGVIDLKNLASENEASPKNVDGCEVRLRGQVSGEVSGYTVYGSDGEVASTDAITATENGEAEITIPVKQLEDAAGIAQFGIEICGTGAMDVKASSVAMALYASSGSGAGIDISHYVGIYVKKEPNKTDYVAGEYFNKSGMVVALIPNRDHEEREITNYKIDKSGALKVTDNNITVSYEGFSSSTPIYVFDEKTYADDSKASADHGESLKVNLATGRLLYIDEELSAGANSYKISVSPVYNSKLYSSLSTYFGGMPRGWKLDAHQCIIPVGNKYKYVDGAGYIHNFVLFDSARGRYHDEEGQGLILTLGSGRYITDRQGNRLEFDSAGRLVRSISAKSNSISKIYEYSENLLTKIYDARKSTTYLQFAYKDGLLNGIHVVENGKYKKSVTFEYTADKLLQYKTKVCGTLSKCELKYTYDGRKLLQSIEKKLDNSKVIISYDEYRCVKKLESGYLSGAAYTSKSSLEYNYVTPVWYERVNTFCNQIINSDGIKLDYYFNAKGEALTVFERTSNGLLTTQKEQGELLYTDSGSNGINGIAAKNVSDMYTTLKPEETEFKDKGKYFAVTMWVNHFWKDAKARICLKYKNNGSYKYAYADIDGSAYGAWQYVSIPFELTETKGKILISDISVKTTKSGGSGSIKVSDCRIVPSTLSTLTIGGNAVELMDIKSVNLYGSSNRTISCDTSYRGENFVTYNDLCLTLLNMAHNKMGDYFDFVYCNGTKVISGVSGVDLVDISGQKYPLFLSSDGSANLVSISRSGNDNETQSSIKFGAAEITSTVNYKKGNAESNTRQVVSYNGNVMSETDEYGVTKKYDYNTYGDLNKVTLIGTDGKTITLQENTFDSSNEYITRSSSGYDSEEYAYVKPFDALDKTTVNEYNLSNDTYSTTYTTVKYGYDPLGERLMSVSAMDGSHKSATHWIGYNSIGIASASDGLSKYYFEGSHATEKYTFGVTEDTAKIKLQTASVYNKTKTNEIYRTNGSVTDKYESTYDNYGRLSYVIYNSDVKVVVDYESGSKTSALCAGVSNIYDGYTDRDITYIYTDGVQTGWETDNFKFKTVNGVKQYAIGGKKAYGTKYQYDTKKYGSPRVTEIRSISDTGGYEMPEVSFISFYDYNKFGLLEHKKEAGIDYNYTYVESGTRTLPLVKSCTFKSHLSGGLNGSWEYDYDNRGNIKTITKTVNGETETKTYKYDKFGRLIDENGNKYIYDEYGRMKVKGICDCKYDKRGRLIKFQLSNLDYDNYGNCIQKDETIYSYTRGNLLERISGLENVSGDVIYTYDLNGVRYSKTVNGVTTTYYYDGDKLIGEDRSNGIKLRYFYDEQGVCGFKHIKNGLEQDFRYVRNILGDVEYLLDSQGKVVAEYYYDIWGNSMLVRDFTGYGEINPFRYRGYYYDTESRLYYLITRYYDPRLGVFLTRDSAEYLEPEEVGGVDLYAYCYNNPIMYSDPTGNMPFLLTVFLLSLAAGAISGAVNVSIAAAQGQSGRECLGAFFGGFISGAVLGAAAMLGGGLAVGAYTASLATYLGTAAYLTVGTFVGGGFSYWVENKISGKDIDWREAAKQGGLTVVQGAFSFLMGYGLGGAGLWESLKPGKGLFNNIMTKGLFNGMSSYISTNAYSIGMRAFIRQIFTFPWNLLMP